MTEKKLKLLECKCYDAVAKLDGALSDLAIAASEVLGFDVNAALCTGNEIEFRRVDKSGLTDADSFIYMEDILSKLK